MVFFDNLLGRTVKLELDQLKPRKSVIFTVRAIINYWNSELKKHRENKYPLNKSMAPDILYRFLGHKYSKRTIGRSTNFHRLPPFMGVDQLIAFTTDLIVEEYGIKHSLDISEIERIVRNEANSMKIKLKYY